MTLDTFFHQFDEFAAAPNAIQKMRELILELAVRGRLVEQDDRHPPASELLEEAFIERARLVSDHKIKARVSIPIETEISLYILPSTWKWARLSDVGHELGQKVPNRRFTYIDVGSIDSRRGYVSDRVAVLEPNEAPSRARKLVARGTVIYSTVRPYLQNIAIIDKEISPEPIVSTAFGILHPFAGIDNRYLFYWLRSTRFTAYVQGSMKGMAYPAINDDTFYSGLIPIPPFAEQQRIVAKVDELMTLCDRLEAEEAERKEKGRRLSRAALAGFAEKPTVGTLGLIFHTSYDMDPAEIRKAILELAVRGKLVEQNLKDGSARELLLRIGTLKKEVFENEQKNKATTVNWIHETKGTYTIPANWVWARFGDIMINRDAERIPISRAERATKTKIYDYYGASGIIDKIDGYLFDKPLLLIGEDGANLINRSTPIAFIANGKYWVNNHAHVLDGISIDFLRYIELYINAIELLPYVTGSAQPKMNQSKMNSISIPLPPLPEQKRIVAKVDELMALVDRLEVQLAESRALSERLIEAAIAAVIERAQRQGARLVPTRTSIADEELREALLISRIVSITADSDHPLGRFRRTKFSYLAHRRAGDDVTKHYIKKAAGPYSPWAKFDGPENIARVRGYVQDTKADPLEGMIAGGSIAEVDKYTTDPLVGDAVDWVMKNFRYETNDNLELFTTVDFAAVGLRKEGKEIAREEIKKVIARNKEWAAKLKRELFSDENIGKALKKLARVFPEMYGN
ncbi:MAG: restriction endonuclease subunit S [Rectinemataceae bacterium]